MSDDPKNRQYKDVSGNPCSLWWLVKNEPEWAVNQIRHRDKLESERDESNEYARKLSLKVTDQGVEIQRFSQRISELKGKLELAQNDLAIRTSDLEKTEEKLQRKQDAGDQLFEELDDKTPDPRCNCIPHGFPCLDCDMHSRSRAAIKAWKEANK